MTQCFKRCRYVCSIDENDGYPQFSVTIIEENEEAPLTLVDKSVTQLWKGILDNLERLRKANNVVKIFPDYLSGEYMFGLSEPHIIRLIESLPGVETLTNYAFKYGRLQLLDMPLTINPTGCARSEPKLRTHFRKSHTLTCNSHKINNSSSISNSNNNATSSSSTYETGGGSGFVEDFYDSDEYSNQDDDYSSSATPNMESSSSAPVSYIKQFMFSKSTQFKKLKAEWRSNVFLAKSQIQVLKICF
jgi:hypothetical protein